MCARGSRLLALVSLALFLGSATAAVGVEASTGAPEPADVVKAALRAQVDGDVEALLSHFALDRMDEAAIADGRLAFQTFGERVQLSKLKVRPLATGYGDIGDMAVVRAEVAVRLAADGETYRQTSGIIATLVGGEGAWRLLTLDPDDLLNAEIFERERPVAAITTAAAGKRAVTLHQINALLNTAMTKRTMSEAEMAKLTADGQAAFIGRFPGVGDTVAQVYQVANVGYNLYQGARELLTRGFTPIFAMQVAQTAVGAAQIATELVPGVDSAADTVGMYVENVANHMEMQRAIREFQAEYSQPAEGYDAHVYLVPDHEYPVGMKTSLDPEIETAHGRPIQGISFTNPADLGRAIPLQVVAEMTLSDELERFAELLGARQAGGILSPWRIAVDVSLLATPDLRDQLSGAPRNDAVLQDPRLIRSRDGASTAWAWTVTCTRGFQQLEMLLPNDTPVAGPRVAHKIMNEIRALRVTEVAPDGTIKVPLSEPKEVQVFAVPSTPGVPEFDLTPHGECLEITTIDTETIAIERDRRLRIIGVAPGVAPVQLRLPAPRSAIHEDAEFLAKYPTIERDVQVVVTDDIGGRWQGERSALFYNDQWTVTYTASVTTTGGLDGCEEQGGGSWLVLTCPVPPAPPAPPEVDRFTVTVTLHDVDPVIGWKRLLEPLGKGWSQHILLGFSEPELAEVGMIRTTLEVPRGPGQHGVAADVVVWLRYDPDPELSRWTSGGQLFSLRLMGQ